MKNIFVVDGNGDTIGRYIGSNNVFAPCHPGVYLDQFKGFLLIEIINLFTARILSYSFPYQKLEFSSNDCSGSAYYRIPFVGKVAATNFSMIINCITGEVYTPTGNVIPPSTVEINSTLPLSTNVCDLMTPYMNNTTYYEVQATETLPFTYPFVTPLQLEHR